MVRALQKIVYYLEKINIYIGNIVAWLILSTMIIVMIDVSSRKLFKAPVTWGYDLTLYTVGVFFLLGMGYAATHNAHVGVDVVYQHFSPKTRAILGIIINIFIIFPFLYLYLRSGIDYAAYSWSVHETLGLTVWDPIVYPIKTCIPLSYFFLMLQAVADTIKHILALLNGGEEHVG